MSSPPESLLAKLIPGDLENQIPAAVEKVLPGGFKNRLVQAGLGVLLAFGLSFIVKRMLEWRERKAMLARPAPRPQLARPAEPAPMARVAPAMTQASTPPLPVIHDDGTNATRYPLLGQPHVTLSGNVDQAMYRSFRDQIAAAPHQGTLVVSISTLGGDPEIARLMGDEIRLLREYNQREILFLGKVAVYSAGATFMAAFPADKRFVTRGTRIMIHERSITKTVELAGPLKSCVASLKANLHEIEESVRIEEEGFRDLVAGTNIPFEDVRARAPENWYIEAEEARSLGLVLDVI